MTDHKSPSQLKRLSARLGAEIRGWGRGGPRRPDWDWYHILPCIYGRKAKIKSPSCVSETQSHCLQPVECSPRFRAG